MSFETSGSGGALRWLHGAAAGLAAGVAMGLFVDGVMGKMLVIGALWNWPTAVGGWTVHLVNSVAFGVGFAALTRVAGVPAPASIRSGDGLRCLGLALAYGVVLWVVAAALVMPVWLDALGWQAPPVPNLAPPSLVAHLVYGGVLAASIPVLVRTVEEEADEAGATRSA